jgi:iron complex transport system permease protein
MGTASTTRVLAVLLGLTGLAVVASLSVGDGALGDPELGDVYLRLRAARAAAAALAGAALAVAGVLVQGLFRNPLASPSILGTTAGAALGGQLALVAHGTLAEVGGVAGAAPEMLQPLACLVGAGASLAVLLAFLRRGFGRVALLLTGFILASLFASVGAFLTTLAQEEWAVGRAVVAFTLGGVGGVGLRRVALAAPLVLAAAGAAWFWGRPLDLMLSGEEEARALGLDVDRTRRWAVVWAAIATGAAVSLGGNVAFVGLVAPHALRPLVGAAHRRLVPTAAVAGAAFLIVCDVVARAAPTRGEMPLGVLTGLVGAPLFLMLLLRHREDLGDG